MDMSTVGGLAGTTVLLVGGILLGGPLMLFFDAPSVAIVCGGTVTAVFIAYPIPQVKAGLTGLRVAFMPPEYHPDETVKQLEELSQRARREGLLSLEEAADAAEDEFLQRGLRLMVDGHEPSAIEGVMFGEIDKIDERHKGAIAVWDGVGDAAPAMGLLGTLIGLVQMLANMSDPSSIGPAMAVALLTTFYGAILANVIGIPIANKLKLRNAQEIAHKELIAQGLMSIMGGENPRFMVEKLQATLPPALRSSEAA